MEIKNKDGLTEKEFLEQYNPGDYPRPSVTTDMIILTTEGNPVITDLKILLIKRKDHPYINHWALPGGFCGIDECLYDCAKRELKEETGVDFAYLEQLYTFSAPNRDPRMRVISTTYMGLVPQNRLNVQAGDDASDAKWFSVVKDGDTIYLTNEEEQVHIIYKLIDGKWRVQGLNKLAFDHIEQIDMAIDRIRNKLWYTKIAFNLLPPVFTLNQIQSLYEVILNEKLVKPNFRTRILKFVEEKQEIQQGVPHRPAKLFKVKYD